MAVAAPSLDKLIKAVILCILCVSPVFQGGALPCDINFLMDLRKVIYFQFVQLLSCKDGSDEF